jgi:hypothetical protein
MIQIVAAERERRITRRQRAEEWLLAKWNKFWSTVENNPTYKVLAILSTLATVVSVVWGLLQHFHLFGV